MKRYAGLAVLWVSFAVHAIPEGPDYPSAAWAQREASNFAKVLEAPTEQVSSPVFMQRLLLQSQSNLSDYLARDVADPSWLLASSPLLTALLASATTPADAAAQLQATLTQIQQNPSSALALPLNLPVLPLCTTWAVQCAGDPFRYPGVDPFYTDEAVVTPVVFYDDGCARLSGRVWAPKSSRAGSALPAVVIENGSVQAPEPLYWWMAQLLVRNGYIVMTFDPRGQGRSDLQTPGGAQGGNFNSSVFWTGLVNAIDFFRSTPVAPYPHNLTCANAYPTATTTFNPYYDRIDRNRLGIAGHSLGATGVSIVQGYGAKDAQAWPGKLDADNPVKVALAWDGLSSANTQPRVPSMGQSSEYGLTPSPKLQPPDPEGQKTAYAAWKTAGVPVYQFTIQGSTHYEWSLIPTFPASSWCPQVVNGQCSGGWGNPMAQHYSLAWLDRWLKTPGEPGYDTADARLLDDAHWLERYSFYSRSARNFPLRNGRSASCEDIRAGCSDVSNLDGSRSTAAAGAGGGGLLPLPSALILLGLAVIRRHWSSFGRLRSRRIRV